MYREGIQSDTAEITSSTYRFQKKGFTGELAKALCSTSSITIIRPLIIIHYHYKAAN